MSVELKWSVFQPFQSMKKTDCKVTILGFMVGGTMIYDLTTEDSSGISFANRHHIKTGTTWALKKVGGAPPPDTRRYIAPPVDERTIVLTEISPHNQQNHEFRF